MRRVSAPDDIYPVFHELFSQAAGSRCRAVSDTEHASDDSRQAASRPLFDGAEWNFDLLKRTYDAIEEIGVGEMGLDVYPNQIEVITAEQMLDAYASIGMPIMYRHWSFGKHFAREDEAYRKGGMRALAYELVINSDPCINYIMEENTMTMQTLVMAHAAMGHNHFFKNNYLFRQWTERRPHPRLPGLRQGIRRRVRGAARPVEAVEAVLDTAHALMNQGISRHRGPVRARRQARAREGARAGASTRRRPTTSSGARCPRSAQREGAETPPSLRASSAELGLPQENLLYFLEKHAPKLEDWQRELLRIVRMLAQYFYPQRQTKVMNEGCATFVHYEIMNRLYDHGLLTEGSMLEFMHSHSSVVFQPASTIGASRGLNPYALGFAMMRDIKRICDEPTAEDRDWFPDFAGNGDWMGTLNEAWANFRDDSFILQYLSPKVIRDFRLFAVTTTPRNSPMRGEGDPRRAGLQGHPPPARAPVRRLRPRPRHPGHRCRSLRQPPSGAQHRVRNGVLLDKSEGERTLQHVAQLWGYRVKLVEQDVEGPRAQGARSAADALTSSRRRECPPGRSRE